MNNNIPDFQTIMYPMLDTLKDGQPRTLNEVMDSLGKYFKLTEEDLRIKVPSGQMGLFRNRVGWTRSYLKNAGLITYPSRGVYQISETGKKVLTENISYINIAYLKKFEDFQRWQNSFSLPEENIKQEENVNKTPEEILGDTFKDLNNKLGYELLEILKNKPFDYFEYFVLQLLSKMGYGGIEESNFEVVGKSGDNGIDGIIYQDKLGIDRIYVQAKRWKDNKVQSKDIRDFIGSLSLKGTNKGIFITTSEFTDDAEKTAKMNPQNRIILIDGSQLVEHAIEFNVGVQIKKLYEVKDLDNDFFEEL
ncbi:MAG: restriction endonuclease [Lacibacter sp.]